MRAHPLALLVAIVACATARADVPADLDLVPFASGLASPLAVRHAGDGSGRVYVAQKSGQVIAFSASGVRLGTVLDLGGQVSTGSEQGLLGLAFHPDFPADPRLFVDYTNLAGDTVVASYTVAGNPPVASAASAVTVLRVDQDFANHNGGDLHFGPDGYLYVALGDGGGGFDPCNRAQTLAPGELMLTGSCVPDTGFTGNNPESLALLGKLLRIDIDGNTPAGHAGTCGGNADGSANYAIPQGNPYAGGGTANGCDEVWHLGLRNPFRFSFDRANGDLFIGDVGQNAWEEIDRASGSDAGVNFGWNLCEGMHTTGSTTACGAAGTTLPIIEYAHTGGDCSVTGGFRYRGPITIMGGHYIYADYCTGKIWIATQEISGWSTQLWRNTGRNLASFGEDEDGDLYVADISSGQVLRFESAQFGPAVFADGFESL